jgi:hypothetical protein
VYSILHHPKKLKKNALYQYLPTWAVLNFPAKRVIYNLISFISVSDEVALSQYIFHLIQIKAFPIVCYAHYLSQYLWRRNILPVSKSICYVAICTDYAKIFVFVNEFNFSLGCLHPVACVRSGKGSFYIRLHNVAIVG